jgi:hypothetical protein
MPWHYSFPGKDPWRLTSLCPDNYKAKETKILGCIEIAEAFEEVKRARHTYSIPDLFPQVLDHLSDTSEH